MKKTNILITGSNGLIGRELIKELQKKRKYNITTFNRSTTKHNKKIKIIKGNIINEKDCIKACKGKEIIVHLAAILNEKNKELFKVNVIGTKNIISACEKQKIKQLIFVSTAGVYGNKKKPINEKTTFNPITNYEKSKAIAEQEIKKIKRKTNTTILRAALVLGPNKYWKNILKLVKKGFPLIGSGKNNWQMIYYKDLVKAIAFTINNKKTFNKEFIIAEKEKNSLEKVYKIMCKELKVKENKKRIPVWIALLLSYLMNLIGKKPILIPEHIIRMQKQRNYNTKKINSIGWKPKYKTKEAIKETIKELKLI